MSCPHCKFMEELFKDDDIKNNREYWIMTEVFVYLHEGKDYCDYGKEKKMNKECSCKHCNYKGTFEEVSNHLISHLNKPNHNKFTVGASKLIKRIRR